MFLMSGEESCVKLAPAPCANADEIILLWVVLGVGECFRIGTGYYKEKQQVVRVFIVLNALCLHQALGINFLSFPLPHEVTHPSMPITSSTVTCKMLLSIFSTCGDPPLGLISAMQCPLDEYLFTFSRS